MKTAIDMFLLGDKLLRAQHQEQAKTKIHTLRGGSAGCLLADGTTLGGCPHEALARFMGYESNSILSQGYFDAGIANEMIWERNAEIAVRSPDSPYNAFRCEEDIPVVHQLGRYKITGRPDLVYGTFERGVGAEFVPMLGTELKAACAISSGAKRLYGLKPDTKHLCQAGFYAKKIGCDWTIPYTINITGDLGFFDKKNYEPEKKLALGKIEFPIEWRKDVLYYQKPSGEWIETLITWQGILDYYQLIVEMYETQQIGLTHISDKEADGSDTTFDFNQYNDFTNMVPITGGWDTYIEYCDKMATSPRFIKYARKKYRVYERPELKGPHYIAGGVEISTHDTLTAARRAVYG